MIVFDLDGCLADCEHRRHLVDPRKAGYEQLYNSPQCFYSKRWLKFSEGENIPHEFKPDWQAFYEACDQDSPIQPVIEMWNTQISLGMMGCHQIWSGRCESVRKKTEDWLDKNLLCFDPKQLKMRPLGNPESDEVLMERWLEDTYEETKWGRRTPIQMVFDDRPKVIRMWRNHGIFVFNCAQHDREF